MPRIPLLLALICLPLLLAACGTRAGASPPPGGEDLPRRHWSATARDVWIDGTLTPEVRCLHAVDGNELLVWLPGWSSALVLGKGPDGSERSMRLPSGRLRWGEPPLEADSLPGRVEVGATPEALAEGGWRVDHESHRIRVLRHEGLSGPVDRETVFATVPDWRLAWNGYIPDPVAVAELEAVDQPFELTLVLGTWCGDSRREVPRLLRVLEEADNPRLRLSMHAVRRGFSERPGFARDNGVTRVPTVIVRRGGVEVGRFVESPVGDSIEQDLASIIVHGETPGGAAPAKQ